MRVYADPDDLARAARAEVLRRGEDLIRARGRFALALSGGSTPRRLYALLRPEDLDWTRVQVFFGDERCVPPGDADSNYRTAREALFDRVPLPQENVHRIRGELAPDAAARAYEADLRAALGAAEGAFPRLDLVLLGMGADGHTASLFPGSSALLERSRAVVECHVEALDAHRVTLTLPAINAAEAVLFLVTGAEKAEVVRRVLRGGPDDDGLPARCVRPGAGRLIWMLDAAAAAKLA